MSKNGAEIAGQRTLISCRPDLTVKNLLFRIGGVELRNVQIAPLRNPRLAVARFASTQSFQHGST